MSASIQAALAAAVEGLAAAGVPNPARDARILMAGALGVPLAGLAPLQREPLPAAPAEVFAGYVAARRGRRPVAQILGRREFWGRSFEVTPDVLDPRPETEALVALALQAPAPARLLDLGLGSGAILVTLLAEWPQARGIGTDLSAAALDVAARNASRHGVANRAELRRADWTEGLVGPFDLIVCNPPYIPASDVEALAPEVRDWEPRLGLTPGPRGLEAYERIAAALLPLLDPCGRGLFEIGAGQGEPVAALFRGAGFGAVALHPDLEGRDRVVSVAARSA